MFRTARFFLSLALVFAAQGAFPAEDASWHQSKAEQKKAEIDAMARQTLDRLFAGDQHAKTLFDMSFGYAVFDNLKITLGLSGGGGSGVAVVKETGQRIYMKMGSGGIGIGLGGQRSRIVFLFEDRSTFEDFVYNGWQGDAAANAVAGTRGENAITSFTQGMVMYQMTESGLMLKADVSGTKYWVDKKLNRLQRPQPEPRDSRDESQDERRVQSEALEPEE